MLSNIQEIGSREHPVMVIAAGGGDEKVKDVADDVIGIPRNCIFGPCLSR